MSAETQLAIVATFAGFLLKASLAFLICWALSELLVSPSKKFKVWLAFLSGSACYWLWLIQAFVPIQLPRGRVPLPSVPALTGPVGNLQLQTSWAFPVSIALPVLGALYSLVLGYFLLAGIKQRLQLRWVLRFAYKAPKHIEDVFRSIVQDMYGGRVRLLVLSGIPSPATFGWVRPTVLLPSFCLERDGGELEYIFRHELHHIRRLDFACNAIASLCRALLFFHPAAWYAMRRLQLEREFACDLAVVCDSPDQRAMYAECLIRFARLNLAEAPRPWNLDFAGKSVQLKARIHKLLSESKEFSAWLLSFRAACGILLCGGFLTLLPSLRVALSYAQREINQSANPALTKSAADLRPQRRSKARKSVSIRPPIAPTASAAPLQEEVQLVPQVSAAIQETQGDFSLHRNNLDGADSSSTASSSGNTPTSRLPPMAPGVPGAQRPSVTSIITDAAAQIGRIGDHDHDKDLR